jgi:hypothetical protein
VIVCGIVPTKVTTYMMATSEIYHRDRRGVTPQHIFNMAMEILRPRVSEGLYATFRCVDESKYITKRMIVHIVMFQ